MSEVDLRAVRKEVQARHYELPETPQKCACSQPWPCRSIEKALADEIERLREALRFYAAEVNYEDEMGMRPASPIALDGGKRARAALHTDVDDAAS